MNYFSLVPVSAFFVSLFLWIYVFAQRKRDPVNLAFLLFTGNALGWIGSEILLYFPASAGCEKSIFRLVALFWITCGFWFLNFAYALVGRRKDAVWAVSLLASLAGVAFTVFTDAVILGHYEFYWGIAEDLHPVYQPLIATIAAFMASFGLLLIVRKCQASSDPSERMALSLLIGSSVIVLGSIIIMNVFIPRMFEGSSFPHFGSSAFTVLVVFIFVAITRYRFLSISPETVAEELFADIREGVILIDLQGRIQRSNQAARNMLGDELDGRAVGEILDDAVPEGDVADREIRRTVGKENRCLALSSSSVSRGGEKLGRILIVRDITEERRAAEVLKRSKEELELEVAERTKQLEQAQKLEAIGTLAGGIAHDFNNVLAAILGFAHAARNDLPKDCTALADLDEVIVAAKRGRDIVRQILTVSRKQDVSELTAEDIVALVRETLDLFKVSLPGNVILRTAIHPEPILVLCDSTKITQVVMNLCTNAVHAMKEKRDGRLLVGLELVTVDSFLAEELTYLKPGPAVRLFIRDNGTGISEQDMPQIFNPFFTTKPQGEGTGLGLAFAYAIVRNHEGDILVESEVGKGSTFSVYLPVIEGDIELLLGDRRATEAPPLAHQGQERILVVDDEPQIQRMGRRVLEQLGYEVITASGGSEALAMITEEKERFDLVVTDYSMPRMNGLELARAIREAGDTVPIIMMSGFRKEVTKDEMDAAGIMVYIQKPVSRNALGRAVREVLDEHGEK